MSKKFERGIEIAFLLLAIGIAITLITIDYFEDQYTIELQQQIMKLQKENEVLRKGLILANDYIDEILECVKSYIDDMEFYDVITEIGVDYWEWYYQYWYNQT